MTTVSLGETEWPTPGRQGSAWIPRSSHRGQAGVGGDRPARLPAPSSPSPSPFSRSRVGAALLARWRRRSVRFPPRCRLRAAGSSGRTFQGRETRPSQEDQKVRRGAGLPQEPGRWGRGAPGCAGPGGRGAAGAQGRAGPGGGHRGARDPSQPLSARQARWLLAGRLCAAPGALPFPSRPRGRATGRRGRRSCRLGPAPRPRVWAGWRRRGRVLPVPGSEGAEVGERRARGCLRLPQSNF